MNTKELEKRCNELFFQVNEKTERIAELEKENAELEKENAELRKVAEFQQSSNMDTHLENKKLKEGLAVGSMWNKHLNSQNKALEEERDKYRNMVFDKDGELQKWKDEWQKQVQKATDEGYARTLQTIQLTKAKKLLKNVVTDFHNMDCVSVHIDKTIAEAERFLKDSEAEK